MIKLKDYQQDAVDSIKNYFNNSNSQYIEMPTGSGKTFTFLYYAKYHSDKTLIIVPSIQIMNQVFESSLNFYNKSEISRKGGRFKDNPKKIHIIVVNSIQKDCFDELINTDFDLIIIDEAHHVQSEIYKKFICKKNKSSKTKFLGVTATPDRSDGLFIKEILGNCSFKLDINEMIKKQYLSDIEGYCVKTKIDLSGLPIQNGNFSSAHLYKKLCVEHRNNIILKICKEEMENRKTLIFCINIEHSKIINNLLNENGVSSGHIDGKMTTSERKIILDLFRNGTIKNLCNCQLLTEGFDEPSIDGIVLTRPTSSRSLFIQMIGRGLRLYPGKKNCKIIDIVDNHSLLSGFNSIVSEANHKQIERFSSIKDIDKHVKECTLKVEAFHVERIEFFNEKKIDKIDATESMINYLKKNEIHFQYPISFNEGSFLIWFNELKKEYDMKKLV